MLRLQIACQLLGQCACRCASPRELRGSRGNANGLFHPSHPSPPRHLELPLLCRYAGTCRWVVVTVWRGGPAHTPPQRPAPAAPGVRPFTLGKAPGRVQCGTEVASEAALAIGLVRCRRKAPERCTGRPSALQRHATGGNHGMADTTLNLFQLACASCRDFDKGPAGFHVYFPGGSIGSYSTVKVNQITRNSPGSLAFKNPLRITGP